MSRRIIIDLDHTLLDTTRFKTALANSLGLSIGQWNTVYHRALQDNEGIFDEDIFLKGASNEDRKHFNAVLKKLQTFLYSDSLDFLTAVIGLGWEVVVVTFGNKPWQDKKLKALKPYLPPAVMLMVSPSSKIEQIQHLVTDHVIMIDDNAKELDAIKQAFPRVIAYWMCRPDGKYKDIIPFTEHQMITSLNQINL